MKDNLELLQDAMGSIDDDLIIDAEQAYKKAPLYRKYLIAAACFVLICGAIFTGAWMMRKSPTPPIETPINTPNTPSTPEENRFINCEPGRDQSGGSPTTPTGSRTKTKTYGSYLAAKKASGFTEVEGWLPWEQFSALGEFYSASWWDGDPFSSQFEYKYTNPDTGESWIYYVSAKKLPEKAAIANMVEYYQWYYGKELPEDYFEKTAVLYTANDFDIADLTKQQTKPNAIFVILDKTMEIQIYGEERLSPYIVFVYNGYYVLIAKCNSYDPSKGVIYDSSEDPEIIRRLTNTQTYMEAIEELMNPENATYIEN